MMDDLAASLAGSVADFVGVLLVENGNRLRMVAAAHVQAGMQEAVENMRGALVFRPAMERRALAMLQAGNPIVENAVSIERIVVQAWSYLEGDVRALDPHAITVIPLRSDGKLLGGLLFYRCRPDWQFEPDEVEKLVALGRDAARDIQRLRARERERRAAESLQHAMLPERLPRIPGMTFAIHYAPGSNELEVGGDWYDALDLGDGKLLVSIGDVAGRGPQAAGTMGELRQVFENAARKEHDPARILDTVDAYVRALRPDVTATAFAAVIDRKRDVIRYAGAGHPPALLRRENELVELQSTGLPIGLRDRDDAQQSMETGAGGADFLLLYTDGLIEATRDIRYGQLRAAQVTSSQAVLFVQNPARFICEACAPAPAEDDTAAILVSFRERPCWRFHAENAQAADDFRHEFVDRIAALGWTGQALNAAELIFGELVANVVTHTPGPVEVYLDLSKAQSPVLHVIDRGTGTLRKPRLPADPLSETGRGLFIVENLSSTLEVEHIEGWGNHVAVTLKREP